MRRSLAVAILAFGALFAAAFPALAATQALYLRGSGVPLSWLDTTSPSNGSVKNVDWIRNQDPGLTLVATDDGWRTTDSRQYQDFALDADGLTMSGSATLTIWTAVAGFENAGEGGIAAHLLSCNRFMGGCNLLTETSTVRATWGADGDWIRQTLTFPAESRSFDNRLLVLRITVPSSVDNDMWIAYDSTITPAVLDVDLVSGTTTTTTTTTTTSTTTTVPTSTTTTTVPTSTTTHPSVSTTTTTTSTTVPTSTTTTEASTTTTTDQQTTTTTADTGGGPSPTTTLPTSTTTAPVAGDRLTNTELQRGSLIVRNSEDVAAIVVEPHVRSEITPTRHLSVTFTTITESFGSSVTSAIVLGGLGAVLGVTAIDKTAEIAIRAPGDEQLDKTSRLRRLSTVFSTGVERMKILKTRLRNAIIRPSH